MNKQVANDGYEAFNKAHKNMDAIRLMTVKVPDHMRSSLDILYKVNRTTEYILS